MSFASEVIADNSGKFCGNSLRFATRAEAETYVADLAMRWTLVRETRVVESSDPVNYAIIDGKHVPVAQAESAPVAPVGADTFELLDAELDLAKTNKTDWLVSLQNIRERADAALSGKVLDQGQWNALIEKSARIQDMKWREAAT